MIYKVFCKLNNQYVSHKINNAYKYAYCFGEKYSDLERCNLITTENGKTYIDKKAADKLCRQLNSIVNQFEVREFNLEEK
jgi:hypothetical protein